MDIEIDFPKKITRKTHKEWTQHCEVEFILFDLPVECMMKNKSLSFCLKGYIEGLKYRTKDYGEGHKINKKELFEIARQALRYIPRVWNLGETKDGVAGNIWGIHYPKKNIVEYTSY